eukprot:symbB.v1.2.024374.t1/scaffold2250.1/size119560/8
MTTPEGNAVVVQPSAQQATATPAMAAPVMPVGGPVVVNPNAPVVSQSAGMLAPSGPPPNFACPCAPATCCCICFDLDTGILIISGCNGCLACGFAVFTVMTLLAITFALSYGIRCAMTGSIAYLLFMGPRLRKPMYFQYAAIVMTLHAVVNAISTLIFGSAVTVTTTTNGRTTSHSGGGVGILFILWNIGSSTAISAYLIYVVLSKKYHLEQQLSAGGY